MNERRAAICISQQPQCKAPLQTDLELYTKRHFIENFFGKINYFNNIDPRAKMSNTSFRAMIYAAAAVINSRRISTDPRDVGFIES